MVLLRSAAAQKSFLFDFLAVPALRYILGHFNSLRYQFLSLELIFWIILTFLPTSKELRWFMLSARRMSFSTPPLPLSLPSAVLPSSPLRLRSRNFPDVLSSDGFTASKPRHGIRHHLLTNPGPPVYSKPRRLDPDKLSAAKEKNSPSWRKPELFVNLLLLGHHLFIW